MSAKYCYIGWCFASGARCATNEERRQAFEQALARHAEECERCKMAAREASRLVMDADTEARQ